MARFDNQRQAFNYLVTLLAAIAGLLATKTVHVEPEWFFWLPIIIAPLGFIFFDNELMIWGIVRYTRSHLHNRIVDLMGEAQSSNVLMLEKKRFENAKTQKCHRVLSLGRWMLFVVPTVASIIYAATYASAWRQSYYVILFLVDCIITILLLWGMLQAASEQNVWKTLSE
jgi:hypothetical protein